MNKGMRWIVITLLVFACIGVGAYAAVDYLAQHMNEISPEAAAAAVEAEPLDGLPEDEWAAYRLGFAVGYDYAVEIASGEGEVTCGLPGTNETMYVVNTHTDRFHRPDCPSVKNIKEANRSTYTGSREFLIDLGFSPCQNCNP